jgi:hypothetical protein
MVDKFKNEKELAKETYKKDELKKLEEINRLNANNKKLKEDMDDIRDKLSKR